MTTPEDLKQARTAIDREIEIRSRQTCGCVHERAAIRVALDQEARKRGFEAREARRLLIGAARVTAQRKRFAPDGYPRLGFYPAPMLVTGDNHEPIEIGHLLALDEDEHKRILEVVKIEPGTVWARTCRAYLRSLDADWPLSSGYRLAIVGRVPA